MENNDVTLWDSAKNAFAIGESIFCLVKSHCPFGILVTLERMPVVGVIERIRMDNDGFRTPDEYPPVGTRVNATILGFRDYSQQIELAIPRMSAKTLGDDSSDTSIEVELRLGKNG